MAAGDHAEAAKLWRGRALQDVPLGPSLRAYAETLTEAWVNVREGALDTQAKGGDAAGAIAGLRGLVAEHPGRESAWCRLIRLLADTGDRAAALQAFQQARRELADTLGLDPGPELRALHAEVLRGKHSPVREIPAQLPRDVPGFAGRTAELAQLDDLRGDAPVTVLVGTAGVGKSALAVHCAHRVRGRFPGGQVFVNLRGFAPGVAAMDPADAIRGFLDAFGVPPERIPVSLDAQAALYRSLLADRKVLVLLDNALRCPRPPPHRSRSARSCRAPRTVWCWSRAGTSSLGWSRPKAPARSRSTCCRPPTRVNCSPAGSAPSGWRPNRLQWKRS